MNKTNNIIFTLFSVLIVIIILALIKLQGDNNSPKAKIIENVRLVSYSDSFRMKYPNFTKNTAIREEMNISLKKSLRKRIDTGFLVDYPLKLYKVEKCDSKYVVEFSSRYSNTYHKASDYEYVPLSDIYKGIDKIDFELVSYVNEKTAKNLTENNVYFVDAKFREYIDINSSVKFCKYILYSPFIGYGETSAINYELEFGAIAVDIISINKMQ